MNHQKLAEFKKFVAFCRKNGVKSAKISENEIAFELGATPQKKRKLALDFDPSRIQTETQGTDEDILFWSAPDMTREDAING